MVKADFTRDYYGDLGLLPGADVQDIKKQFKKLALTYHPDRNPGRESEVTAKFQMIQSAHEVLTDPQERSRYDANRVRPSHKATYTGGTASGMRGNPWSNAGSQWAPPPKPPTARNRAPPQSAGARNYDKFKAAKPASSQSAYEGAQARAKQYEAWERMRSHDVPKPDQSRPVPKPPPPPRNPPKPAPNFKKPAPKPFSNFDEYRDSTSQGSPHRRSASTNTTGRKGFMPTTPGGDEPAAPKGNYFTARNARPTVNLDDSDDGYDSNMGDTIYTPRKNYRSPGRTEAMPDPLHAFRDSKSEEKIPNLEKRYTPYATHGGEKLDPFETANLNRSKSTREFGGKSQNVPKVPSDPNLASTRRPRTKSHPATVQLDSDSSSDGSIKFTGSRSRQSNGSAGPPRAAPTRKPTGSASNSSKPSSKIGQFQQWMKENPGQVPNVDSWIPDGPPLRSDATSAHSPDPNKMYETFAFTSFGLKRALASSFKLPTVSEDRSARKKSSAPLKFDDYPQLFSGTRPATPPSGIARDSRSLNAFEGLQRNLVDQLLSNKRISCSGSNQKFGAASLSEAAAGSGKHQLRSQSSQWHKYEELPTPSSKPKSWTSINLPSHHHSHNVRSGKMNGNTDNTQSSFTIPVDESTFQRTNPAPNGFTSNSAENISTKFSADDWAGKFEAGAFQPNLSQKATGPQPRGRAQSTSRSRGRSPIKVSTASKFSQPSETRTPQESPGGTRFSAEEWSQYFKPGTTGLFDAVPGAPPRTGPSRRSTRGSVARPTMGGKAAVVDDSETPDEKPLFDSKPSSTSTPYVPSPDAMDVDTPPPSTAGAPPPPTNTVPLFGEVPTAQTSPSKRRAAPSQPQTPTGIHTDATTALKINFSDLKISDIITSLELPSPPDAPTFSRYEPASYEIYKQLFAKYMNEWDGFNNKFNLHTVARKLQVDKLGSLRWESEEGVEFYRKGLKEDEAVAKHWSEARQMHDAVMRDYLIAMEKMKLTMEEKQRPRKKTTH